MITTLLLERTLKPLWVPAFVPAPHNRHLDSSSVAQFPLPFCKGTKGDRRLTVRKSLSIMLRTCSLTLRQWAGGRGGNGAEEPVRPAPEEGDMWHKGNAPPGELWVCTKSQSDTRVSRLRRLSCLHKSECEMWSVYMLHKKKNSHNRQQHKTSTLSCNARCIIGSVINATNVWRKVPEQR